MGGSASASAATVAMSLPPVFSIAVIALLVLVGIIAIKLGLKIVRIVIVAALIWSVLGLFIPIPTPITLIGRLFFR